MLVALDEFIVEGIPTTIDFHKAILRHPDFVSGDFDTSFIAKHFSDKVTMDSKTETETVARE
jgi:biotin carboxylase